jgi:hypothetical protein
MFPTDLAKEVPYQIDLRKYPVSVIEQNSM